MPFSPTGFIPQYGDRIAELMMRQGEIAARGAERSGMIWGRAIETLGQIAGNAVENYQQQKILKQKDEGIYSVMQSWDGQDPTVLVKGLATYIGPIEAVKVAGGLQKLQEAKQVPQLDASHIAGPVGALAALERSSPGHLQRNWGLIFPQIEGLAKQAGLPVAPEWSEDMTKGVMTLDQQFNPPKAASAPPFQEVNGQGFERGPAGWAPAPGLPTAAPKAEKKYQVTVPGPNGPVTRLATEAEMEAGVREYQKPTGSESPDEAITLTPQALDLTAELYAKTGQLPAMGMGKKGASVRQQIINRAAELHPGADIAGSKAGYEADKGSMTVMQKQVDAVTAFENTASKNAEILKGLLDKIPDYGNRWANKPARSLSGAMGSEDMARFNTIRQSVANEYSRIISNPTLAGVMSDSARAEGSALLDPDATAGQIRAAIETLAAEAKNRHTEYQSQLDVIKKRMKGGTPAPSSEPAKRYKFNSATGKLE